MSGWGITLTGKQIKLSDWPFSLGKLVKLSDISKPYWKENKYWVEVKFLPDINLRYERPFTDLTLLIQDEQYQDGLYQKEAKVKTVRLNLKFSESDKPEPYLRIRKSAIDGRFNNFTFGFHYQNNFYVLPQNVILRDILAPDAELLNLLTMFDVKDTKFLHWMENGTFHLNIMSELSHRYSNDNSKLYHIAWLFTNPNIEAMLAQIFENIRSGNGIQFDWGFERLNCEAVYSENSQGTRFIKRITHVAKKISAQEIVVKDVRAGEHETSEDQVKRNHIIQMDAEELHATGSGTFVDMSDWAPNIVTIEYETLPKIKRISLMRDVLNATVGYTAKSTVIGSGHRTTSDRTSEETAPKLIFKQHYKMYEHSPFFEISEALLALQDDNSVIKVESYVAPIYLHAKTGLFRYLKDGVTERRYFAGMIAFMDEKEAVILDLQRDAQNISMLMLISNYKCEWAGIIHEIMQYTVSECKWPTQTLASLANTFFLRINRCNHTDIDCTKLAKKILLKGRGDN